MKKETKKRVSICLLLCFGLWYSMYVYGSDIADMADTGGFEMDISEGTGELPGDWEENGESSQIDNGENFGNESAWQEEPQREYETEPDRNTYEEYVWENTEETVQDIADAGYRPEEGSFLQNQDAEPAVSAEGVPAEPNPRRAEPTAVPEVSPVPVSPAITVTITPAPKSSRLPEKTAKPSKAAEKEQKLALTYYRTEKSEKSAGPEKEIIPALCGKISENRIQICFRGGEPFQILSFRINGEEASFRWKGKILLAEIPKGTGKVRKTELLGFVKSGKLYHEIVDLTEKQ